MFFAKLFLLYHTLSIKQKLADKMKIPYCKSRFFQERVEMPIKNYEIKATCYSWKCRGDVRTFRRDMWQEFIGRSAPIGLSGVIRSGPTGRAYCIECGTYAHVPLTAEELLSRSGSERPSILHPKNPVKFPNGFIPGILLGG